MAGERPTRYYPALTNRRTQDLRDICETISGRSSLTNGDVMAVVVSLMELVPDLLLDGYNVRLDGFGIFSLHASGKGKDTPEEVTFRDITGVKMAFLPDKHIKRRLRHQTKFSKVKS